MTRRVALVTGAGRRIGADVAKHLSRMGFDVIVHVRSSVAAGETVVEEIRQAGGSARVVACELTDKADIMRMFDGAAADGGVVSVIVNNASYFQYDRLDAPDFDILKKSIDVHVTAPVLIFQCAVERMDAAAGLTIVNILDQKVENINPDYYSYTIGKFALYGITRMWQAMPVPNLRVFGILPGLMLRSGKQPEDNFQVAKDDNLLKRAPTTADLCEMIEYLVNARGVPGQNIALDAGASLMRRLRDVAFVHDRAGELDRSTR